MTKITLTVTAVTSVLSVLVLIGVLHLTADQLAAIGLAVSACLAALAAWFDPTIPVGVKAKVVTAPKKR
jgi:ABC-type bacteriocin/lantibiotic exporter with double-glycine peptidase domain